MRSRAASASSAAAPSTCGEVPGFRTEETPFGGVKASGLGDKEGVIESIRTLTNAKLVTLPWP